MGRHVRHRAIWVGVAATLVVVATACDGQAGMMTASPAPAPSTPSPATTAPPSPGQRGLRVVSVLPPAGATGPWVGQQVHAGYLPAAARVAPARCRLFIDGVRQHAKARVVHIAPANPLLVFSWNRPYAPGEYRFRVEVRTARGRMAVYEWRYRYR